LYEYGVVVLECKSQAQRTSRVDFVRGSKARGEIKVIIFGLCDPKIELSDPKIELCDPKIDPPLFL
jgi:hypothetical protein